MRYIKEVRHKDKDSSYFQIKTNINKNNVKNNYHQENVDIGNKKVKKNWKIITKLYIKILI